MDKMWAGRFGKQLDERVNDFNSSIRFDCRMAEEDISGSIAHATMLAKQGIIPWQDCDKITQGLEQIRKDLLCGALAIDESAEDIHMFIEAELTSRIGDAGKRLHTSRSRNDQVALDLRLYLRKEAAEIKSLIISLADTLIDIASKHTRTVMPGYTHLQRAQPITFAHHLCAYAEMLVRDVTRLDNTVSLMNECPLGSCALAGTTYDIDRDFTASRLGFDRPCGNSLDGVSDRDFVMQLASDLSIASVHLSRMAEEIILWCSWEFKFIELDDAYATGSSIMPQKKNPDIAELIRGKAGRVIGDNMSLLVMMKGLPLAYDKDMQEDKEAIFDACDSVKLCVSTLIPMLATMTVNKGNMLKAGNKGFINATDCADYLVKKGLPFRTAYKVVGTLVAVCSDQGLTLDTLPLQEYKKACELFDEDVYEAIELINCVMRRCSKGGPAPQAVEEEIKALRAALDLKRSK
ncbi:MAG: argininosuccinate lyase [Clostridia bacterium]|nr:argininosuccinate lyase [Clostridia bacterium]